jgi:hypothetical protein
VGPDALVRAAARSAAARDFTTIVELKKGGLDKLGTLDVKVTDQFEL